MTETHESGDPAAASAGSSRDRSSSFDDTGRVLREARRLRLASVLAAVAVVVVFGIVAPLMQRRVGVRTTWVVEGFAVGLVLFIVTSPLARMLKRSIIELHNIRERWRFEAIRDALTGLFNRRQFDERLEEEVARTLRHGSPLSLILTDLDHLKAINDRHGHRAGDAALRELSTRIRRMFRREDVIARIGGDELAILLPDTDKANSMAKAQRMREQIAAHPVSLPADLEVQVTVSCGVASAGELEETGEDLVRRADVALYEAKKTRNSVAAADDTAARPERRSGP